MQEMTTGTDYQQIVRPDPSQKVYTYISMIRVNDDTLMILASNCSKLNDRKLVCNNIKILFKMD